VGDDAVNRFSSQLVHSQRAATVRLNEPNDLIVSTASGRAEVVRTEPREKCRGCHFHFKCMRWTSKKFERSEKEKSMEVVAIKEMLRTFPGRAISATDNGTRRIFLVLLCAFCQKNTTSLQYHSISLGGGGNISTAENNGRSATACQILQTHD
jgi:hypothetical protein